MPVPGTRLPSSSLYAARLLMGRARFCSMARLAIRWMSVGTLYFGMFILSFVLFCGYIVRYRDILVHKWCKDGKE
jgi:formate-dependent nitrite reductase membrane component NrfD